MRSTRGGMMERSITPKFPMILPLSRESEPLLRHCVGLSTVIITDGSHNRSGRWDNIVSSEAAGERLNRARLGIRVPGCSIAWGLRGPRPHHLPGWIPPTGEELLNSGANCCCGALLWVSPVTFHREKCYTLQFLCCTLRQRFKECKTLLTELKLPVFV